MRAANASIPFGLVVAAREPIPVDEVNLSALVYDPERQIMLVRDGQTGLVMPWCKHSTDRRVWRAGFGIRPQQPP